MASEHASVNSESVEQTKQQIRGLVNEIAQLSKSDSEAADFYPAFLQRIVSALAAVGGAVWELGEAGRPQLVYQINLSETLLDPDADETIRHMRLLALITAHNQPQLVPPLSGLGEGDAGNPTRYLLVLAPLVSEGKVEGLVEIFQRPDSQPATQRGYLRFLMQMCELAGDWLKTRKLKQFSNRHSLWAQADQFARAVHESLNVRETAYTIANEGRRLIGCDRVTVAIKRGRKCKVEAVSGQDLLEARSNVIAALGQVASRVVATGEPLWYAGSTDDLPPQVEEALDAYVDESHTRSLAVLPLRRLTAPSDSQNALAGDPLGEVHTDGEILGALIIEQIESDLPRELLEPRVDLVYEHSARALSNAMSYNGIFLMPVWQTLGKLRWLVRAQTLPKTLTAAAALLMLVVALFVVPADFQLKARGALQPVERRDVFFNVDGVVQRLHVADGQWVHGPLVDDEGRLIPEGLVQARLAAQLSEAELAERVGIALERLVEYEQSGFAGAPPELIERLIDALGADRKGTLLVELRNTELQREWQGVQGEINTTLAELTAIQRQLADHRRLTDAERTQLTGRNIQLEAKLRSLERQHELIERKRERLRVHSPIFGLVILPWEIERSLLHRPVMTGQLVMTVADPTSPWHLELLMPENRMGHMLHARRELREQHPDQDLKVYYVLATDPGTTREGIVKAIHTATQLDEEEGHGVQVHVAIDSKLLEEQRVEPRPGARVTANVHCGRRSIGYVWFHTVWEWVQLHLLF